ncbi:DUF2207 domain-containing protein [Marisediminicola sp. LYQ134]|uniref:DUF2207 domain-containing protein n=1 Tax=Marisediminicola sp. LYQ134 TaxID=3391061 RepID=UPI003983C31A
MGAHGGSGGQPIDGPGGVESSGGSLDEPVDGTPDSDRITDDPPQHTYLWALLSGWLLALEAWLRSHGGAPLRTTIRAFWGVVAIAGAVLLVGPVINPPLTLDDITSSASTATETWIARDFAADYTVDLADDGTLTTAVEERITAFFGDEVDESGIERVIATEYEGNDLRPSEISATLDGEPIEVGQNDSATRLTLDLDAGERLDGDHEFVLRYTLDHLAYDSTDRATGDPVQMLEWDVFGPSWPHGVTGLDVEVSLADELDDALIREPRGSVAWTFVSAGAWLSAEADRAPGRTAYSFSNDQSIPPNATAAFTIVVEPDTITMPPRSPVFFVQTFGPLAPLAFLAATLLLAIAARRVAWSDARGRPWFVAQYDTPDDISATMAAHILRSPRALELARELQNIPARPKRGDGAIGDAHLLATGRAARRTGRLGNLPRALRLYARGPEVRRQLELRLREIPDGFVRDGFIAAPLALTLVQWGLVRQLSHQAPLAIVWWPVAFVAVSTVIASVVIVLAVTARPLTHRGALVKQHLRGIGVFAERTQVLERGTLRDSVLPYAVLLAPPRRAGRAIAERVGRERGRPLPRRSWLTADYLTAARLAIRGTAAVLIAGVIAVTILVTNPLEPTDTYLAYTGDVPGSLSTEVASVEVSAELSRSDDGRAVITARETLGVVFDEDGSLPGQVVRQWPGVVEGQSLDLTIDGVRVGGVPVDFRTQTEGDTVVMRTTMAQPFVGEHEVSVDYTIASAAYATNEGRDGAIVDRVRWAALLSGWAFEYGAGDDLVDPLRLELRAADELLAESTRAGWLVVDTSDADARREWRDGVIAFGDIRDDIQADIMVEAVGSADGTATRSLEIGHTDSGLYPTTVTRDDVGVLLDFPRGTFSEPDEAALRAAHAQIVWPAVAIVALSALATALGVLGWVLTRAGRGRARERGPARDALTWLAPASALGAGLLLVWFTFSLPSDDPFFAPLATATVVGFIGAGVSLWAGLRTAPQPARVEAQARARARAKEPSGRGGAARRRRRGPRRR